MVVFVCTSLVSGFVPIAHGVFKPHKNATLQRGRLVCKKIKKKYQSTEVLVATHRGKLSSCKR